MPVAGHWHLRLRTSDYLKRRSLEIERVETAVHVLKADRAVEEWMRLEPPALGHERRDLHEFFCRDRTCLATIDERTAPGHVALLGQRRGRDRPGGGPRRPSSSCRSCSLRSTAWRAAVEPEYLSLFSTTISWWLLRRLRGLGFEIWWPSWVMCSVPLPGLDRYVPTRPPHVL